MADIADSADEVIEIGIADKLAANKKLVQSIPQGCAGNCEWCGEYFTRIVDGACGRCRDKYKLD